MAARRMDTVLMLAGYFLAFWLGAGLYAAIVLRFTGRDGVAANVALLAWLPIFALIVYFWRPLG
jgi:hypothetical protein